MAAKITYTAPIAFLDHAMAAQELLHEIQAGIDRMVDGVAPDEIHYGHVGTMAELAHRLRQAASFINGTEQ